MSRRLFIRRLVASGVALGAAVSYAHLLTPEVKAKGVLAHEYDPPLLTDLQMVPEDLDRVIRKKRVKIKGTSNKPATYVVYLHLYRSPEKSEWPDAVIGTAPVQFDAAGTQKFEIPIGYISDGGKNCGLEALKKQKRKAKIGVALGDGDVDEVFAHAIFYKR
jgi:hypothetical protein